MPQTTTPSANGAVDGADGADASPAPAAPTCFDDVKGWFWPADQLLFDWFLTRQRDQDIRGDLLELGAYLGKSAVFLGRYLRDGEQFTVCDLWDSPAPDASNTKEMNRSYATLTRRAFETNYLAFHDELPTMVQAPTSVIASRVRSGSCRFIHVDASHLYEHVHGDVRAARQLLLPEGVVAFDDFRAEHCPGVAAAVWGAVADGGLKPVVISGSKLYGTWGDPDPVREELRGWLKTRADLWHGVEEVAGRPLIRVGGKKAVAPEPPASRHAPKRREPVAASPPAQASPSGPSWPRRVARELLPPALTRALRALRR
ncbi:class I SAM-dependent methyltransferase [Streptomyces sp. PR69]|uniref:class I SAM-dependent methyltransferase n=1 Tax=Streptomyces sp. PR69 TaxID=2984950 RepID=UPI00226415F8|nr:class I SAM-dependent methyltransferase [Streptomyces sp. PR69]